MSARFLLTELAVLYNIYIHAMQCNALQDITLHYIALRCIALHTILSRSWWADSVFVWQKPSEVVLTLLAWVAAVTTAALQMDFNTSWVLAERHVMLAARSTLVSFRYSQPNRCLGCRALGQLGNLYQFYQFFLQIRETRACISCAGSLNPPCVKTRDPLRRICIVVAYIALVKGPEQGLLLADRMDVFEIGSPGTNS